MTDIKKIRATEELIVALLLGKSEIINKDSRFDLIVSLTEEKQDILYNYLKRHNLNHLSVQKISETEFKISDSFDVERIVRDWTDGTIVSKIDPRLLRMNVYMLWVCLFVERGKQDAYLRVNWKLEVQESFRQYFEQHTGIHLLGNGIRFIIRPLSHFVLLSIQDGRPKYESEVLFKLLNPLEKKKFFELLENREDGLLSNVYYRT